MAAPSPPPTPRPAKPPAPPRVRAYGRINGRGLATLVRRGIKRHLRWGIESLGGAAVSNLLFLTVLTLVAKGSETLLWPGLDIASFVAPGLVAYSACLAAFESMASALVYDKMEGMVQDVLAAPLTAAEMLAGWVLGAACAGLTSGAAVLLVFLPLVDWPAPDLLRILGFALLGTLLFALLGLLVGLWARKWDHYAAAETFVLLPLGLLSGTFFLSDSLPPLGQDLLFANPVFHVIDGVRGGFLGRSDGDPVTGLLVLATLILLLGLLAWRLVSTGWRLKA